MKILCFFGFFGFFFFNDPKKKGDIKANFIPWLIWFVLPKNVTFIFIFLLIFMWKYNQTQPFATICRVQEKGMYFGPSYRPSISVIFCWFEVGVFLNEFNGLGKHREKLGIGQKFRRKEPMELGKGRPFCKIVGGAIEESFPYIISFFLHER